MNLNKYLPNTNLSLPHNLTSLRWYFIVIQIGLILFVNLYLNYSLPWIPLFTVIIVESAFNYACHLYNKKSSSESSVYVFIHLLADVLFLGTLLYFSGGATNALISLLLIPIAIAAVTLNTAYVFIITISAVIIYSILLWLMPMHVMHGNMQGHFIGMWINFIFSAIVVSLFIANMTKTLREREKIIAIFREKQLKQEKVMALGVASAQVTHDLATPLATIRLLTDELMEDIEHEAITELHQQVDRCCTNLKEFREVSLKIREDDQNVISITSCIEQLKSHFNLYYPNQAIEYIETIAASDHCIVSNSSLLPAILNVVNNAVQASNKTQQKPISIGSEVTKSQWRLTIRDFGDGFLTKQFSEIGQKQISSDNGLGMGLLLSNSSFERLKGSLHLANHKQGGATVIITLPLAKNE